MTWTNPVIWQEGMFLRAQHFQQNARWTEALVRARTTALGPWWWGLSEFVIDRDKLDTGVFAILSAQGVFSDGTPFALPGETDQPQALTLDEKARRQLVYLCLADPALAAAQVSHDDVGASGRYRVHEFEAVDTFPGASEDPPDPAPLLVGRLRLRLMLEGDDRKGWLAIPIARIDEVGADGRVRLDEDWIPPVLRAGASARLGGFLDEIHGAVHARAATLAARVGAVPQTAPQQMDFMLLVTSNRWRKLLEHWSAAKAVHPEQVYAAFVQMAGEFATFSEDGHLLADYPPYQHHDLQRSFTRVMADLRKSLAWMRDPGAEQIPLERRENWFRGRIRNTELLKTATFFLVARADMPLAQLQRDFPAQVKIGPYSRLTDLVTSAMRGITVEAPARVPPQLPYDPKSVLFQLHTRVDFWELVRNEAVIGIHVSDMFPNIALELWAVRA